MTISELWRCNDSDAWKHALDRYWLYVQPSHRAIEEELNALDPTDVFVMDEGEFYDFLLYKYFRMKFTAPNRYATTTKYLKKYAADGRLRGRILQD